jgi:hypothetical protein
MVLDELGGEGEGQTVGGDPLGLQDVMKVQDLAVWALSGQTMVAVTLPKEQLSGPIDRHEPSAVQPPAIQGLRPDQMSNDLEG